MNYLITGAASGLGLAMHKALGGVAFTRSSSIEYVEISNRPFDAIIHCAQNSAKDVTEENAHGYLYDNLLLTQKLLQIPHERFVYISSIDVLNPDRAGHYQSCKFFSEALVRKYGRKPLILRPTTLLGWPMRPNTIYRMLTEPNAKLFLSAKSRFNLVLHDEVILTVQAALKDGTEGTFVVGATDSLTLGDIANRYRLTPRFGEHVYDVGWIPQPWFGGYSWRNLEKFVAMLPEKIAV